MVSAFESNLISRPIVKLVLSSATPFSLRWSQKRRYVSLAASFLPKGSVVVSGFAVPTRCEMLDRWQAAAE